MTRTQQQSRNRREPVQPDEVLLKYPTITIFKSKRQGFTPKTRNKTILFTIVLDFLLTAIKQGNKKKDGQGGKEEIKLSLVRHFNFVVKNPKYL